MLLGQMMAILLNLLCVHARRAPLEECKNSAAVSQDHGNATSSRRCSVCSALDGGTSRDAERASLPAIQEITEDQLNPRAFSDVRRAVLDEIAVPFGGGTIRLAQDARIGISGVVYDTALVMVPMLSRLLRRGAIRLKGLRVLELGCGCGTVGLSLAKRGAVVTLTDEHPGALRLAWTSAELNRLAHAVKVQPYAFGEDATGSYDLVLYENWLQIPVLVKSFRVLLATHTSSSYMGCPMAILGLPRRVTKLFNIQQLHAELSSAPFDVERLEVGALPSALQHRNLDADDFIVLRVTKPTLQPSVLLLAAP